MLTDVQNSLPERLRNLLQNPYNTVHHTLSMLLHHLGKLKVRICCVSKSIVFKIESTIIELELESQCSYCPLILMLFKTAEVLPAIYKLNINISVTILFTYLF